jgi:outer membrane protein assembly factor BamB
MPSYPGPRDREPTPDGPRRARWPGVVLAAAGLALGVGAVTVPAVQASAQAFNQIVNPVYVDDSPVAADSLVRVDQHIAAGNLDQAVRVLQQLLDEQPERLVQGQGDGGDKDLFVSVRSRALAVLLGRPELLARYRALVTPDAEPLLTQREFARLERSMLLTEPGLFAAVARAREELEAARFHSARMILESLAAHPDRTGEPGAIVAGYAAVVARYLPPADAEALVKLLSAGQLGAARVEFVEPPPSAAARASGVLDAQAPLSTAGLIAKPLWTAAVTNTGAGEGIPAYLPRVGNLPVPINGRTLTMFPTVANDLVYVNDGQVVSAWDRFTLTPRWNFSAPAQAEDDQRNQFGFPRNMGMGGAGEDVATVAVHGRTVVAATGRAGGSFREGDFALHGLDAFTGRVRWSSTLTALDPTLGDAVVRGPIVIDQGVALLAARRVAPERRVVSLALMGVDVLTGRLRWSRPIGSAGSIPWVTQATGTEGSLVDRGVAFRADRLGVVGAVEVASGRPRWIRRIPADSGTEWNTGSAWQVCSPVADGASIIVVAPDQTRLLRLDAATGKILGERAAGELSLTSPAYIVRVGSDLAIVNWDSIVLIDAASFETAQPRRALDVTPPGIRGRAVVAGGKLLVPTVSGLRVVDPSGKGEPSPSIVLDEPGNVLPLANQLIVADDTRVHSYLLWDEADRLLSERIAASPKDPGPAVTLAELAYRAGKPDRIAGAVDKGLDALKGAPAGEATSLARRRLFDTVHAMVAASTDALAPARPDCPPRLNDPALLARLVDRLGQIASAADERLAVALAQGRLKDLAGDGPGASGDYQRVLDDQAMAAAIWRGPSVSVRGEIEALRRLEGLLARLGPPAYAAQNAQAVAQLTGLGPAPEPAMLVALAERFPLADQTPGLWARAGTLLKSQGQDRAALAALETGLRAAQRIPAAPPTDVGELAGTLLNELRAGGQFAAAARTLRTVVDRFPGVTLTAGGTPIDMRALASELDAKLAAAIRWPSVGSVRRDGAQIIVNWSLMEPVLRDRRPHVAGGLVLESKDAVSVWTRPAGATDPQAPLQRVWIEKLPEKGAAQLLAAGSDAAMLLITDDEGSRVERVPFREGVQAWTSPPLEELFPPDDQTRNFRRAPGVGIMSFGTPIDGSVLTSDVVVAADERTLALVQRDGRAAALDVSSGEVLWKGRSAVDRVADADMDAGTLVVVGVADETVAGGGRSGSRPAIHPLDARTGRAGTKLDDKATGLSGSPRWVRVLTSDRAVVGLDDGVVALALGAGVPDWSLTRAELQPTRTAWVLGDTLVLMDGSRALWMASASTGACAETPLDSAHEAVEGGNGLDVLPVPGGGFAVASTVGVRLYDAKGTLKGGDPLPSDGEMVVPRAASDRFVAVRTLMDGPAEEPVPGSPLGRFQIVALAGTDGRIAESTDVLLGQRPSAIELLDGRIALTSGGVTVVLPAPADAAGPAGKP